MKISLEFSIFKNGYNWDLITENIYSYCKRLVSGYLNKCNTMLHRTYSFTYVMLKFRKDFYV